jgi:hypothetical protein
LSKSTALATSAFFVALVHIDHADVALPGMFVKIGTGVPAVLGIGNFLPEDAHGMFFVVIEAQQRLLDGFC